MNDMRSDGNRCFVCGPGNDVGLKLVFRIDDDDVCRSEFSPDELHCGWDGITHGGIIFSVLDDVMANWIHLNGMRGFTAKCDIRYKGSLPTGTKVKLEGHCIKQRGRLIVMQGKMLRVDSDELVAETEASFMLEAES